MDNSTRICKVCGKEYPYCKTVLKNGEIFRWQDVACCEEHGAEYFSAIMAARGEAKPVIKEEPVVVEEDFDIEDDDEEEDEFDDEDDDE